MKKWVLFIFLLGGWVPLHAQNIPQAIVSASLTTQAASCPATTSTAALVMTLPANTGGAALDFSGTWMGTVSFFASADHRTTFVALNATPSNSTTAATTSTGNGVWQANVAGYTDVCLVATTFSSGPIVASVSTSQASARSGGGGAGGGVSSISGDGTLVTNSASTGAVTLTLGKTIPAGAIVGTSDTQIMTNKDVSSGTNTFPTFNQNTSGSAAKWTTARNLAGNSVDGSANVAFANKFIVQGTTDSGLSGAQFLGALATGLLYNTTTTGGLTTATSANILATCTTCTTSAASLTNNIMLKGGGSQGIQLSLHTDTGTTDTYTGTGGILSPIFTASGTTAGFEDYPQGTTSAAVAPCNTATSICKQAPTTVTSYLVNMPGVAPVVPSYEVTDGCGSAICTDSYHIAPVMMEVTPSDFTDSTSASLQLITGLSTTMPVSKATIASFHCMILFDQASAAVVDEFGVGVTGTAPNHVDASGIVWSAVSHAWTATGTLTALASTTPTLVVSFTPSAITTIWNAEIDGTVDQPSNATPGVLGIYAYTTTGTDNLIVKRGSYCSVIYQ